MRHNATKLLANASDCGLRITGLDGWTQTRLAKTLHIRRETLNAIINRSPGSEPTTERPKLVEACRKLITFAAALSAKDDAVLKNPIDAGNLLSDDGQAYEHHRLRLHRLVEAAVEQNQFTDALCRLGEFASAAMHAPKQYRLRMICNLVTSIQRLLDKPASRETPAAVLRANLSRLYRAERAGRQCGREGKADKDICEQRDYVRGQVGYALVFSGMLLADARLVRRGGERLFAAVNAQPDPSYGHWCNLLRATNDLMASSADDAREWARRIITMAGTPQVAGGFAKSYSTLESKDEIQELRSHWESGADRMTIRRLAGDSRPKVNQCCKQPAIGALIGLVLALASMLSGSAFAGDGRDFKTSQVPTTNAPVTPVAPATPRARVEVVKTNPPKSTGAAQATAVTPVRIQRRLNDFNQGFRIERDVDARIDNAPLADANDDLTGATLVKFTEAAWGENIKSYGPVPVVKPAVAPTPPPVKNADPASPVAKPAPATPAEKAAGVLAMAKNYANIENVDVARKKLQEILKTYPTTPAAEEAKVMLAELAGN
jgi:hypothetical protein